MPNEEMIDFLAKLGPVETEDDNMLDGVDEEPETGVKTEVVPPTPAEEKTHSIPVTALMDEREKRQEWQRKAEEMEKRLQQYEKPTQQERKLTTEQLVETRVLEAKVSLSRVMAEKEFGPELVEEAKLWYDANPNASWQFAESPSPFHDAIKFYQKQKKLTEIGPDPDAYIEAQVQARLKALTEQDPSIAKPKKASQAAPPPSMAKANAGKDTQTPGGFDSLFKK